MKDKNKGFIQGAVAGGIISSIAVLLFAPKAGRELRQDITDQARVISEKTQSLVEKITDSSIHYSGQVKDAATAVIHEFRQWQQKGEVLPEVHISSDAADEEPSAL